jgi:tetraacyldisaccharide 4'-kinase
MIMGIRHRLSRVFGKAVNLRNRLYEKSVLKSHMLSVRVISVGNLSMGGTGKTSFVIWLLENLKQQGINVGVVSRGYGGKVKKFAEVSPGADPKIFGDEPALIANSELGPVFVGANRVNAARALIKKYKVDMILADDAFQHRRLKRDLDIVLIDYSEPQSSYSLVPQGRLREEFEALKRAHVVVETKRNFSDLTDFSHIEDQIPKDLIRLKMDYKFISVGDADGVPVRNQGMNYLLVSGVAGPQGVEKLAREKVNVLDHMIFKDHHKYTPSEAKALLEEVKDQKDLCILTTHKDAVKLKEFSELRPFLRTINLEYQVTGQLDEFFKKAIG